MELREKEAERRVVDYWTRRARDFGIVRQNELRDGISARWLREMDARFSKDAPLDILDAGTGTGYFAILLADPYSKENERLLRDADSQMKTLSPELYAYLDGLKISFGYYLIRRWRQGKPFNVKILRRFIPLYNLYLRIRHAFRRILPFL